MDFPGDVSESQESIYTGKFPAMLLCEGQILTIDQAVVPSRQRGQLFQWINPTKISLKSLGICYLLMIHQVLHEL